MNRAQRLILSLLALVSSLFVGQASVIDYESKYGPYADSQADAYGIPRWLLRAVVKVESGWDPSAVGSAGEVGLMQLKVPAALEGGIAAGDRTNPWANLRAGAKYLRKQYDAAGAGGWLTALGMYNQGAAGAFENGQLTPKATAYAAKILPQDPAAAASGNWWEAIQLGAPLWGMGEKPPEGEAGGACPGFTWYDPGTWSAGFACAFRGGLALALVVTLVGYAAITAIRGGG